MNKLKDFYFLKVTHNSLNSFIFTVDYLSHSDTITNLHSADLDFVREMKSL